MITYEEFTYNNNKQEYINDLNTTAIALHTNSNYTPVWDLIKKYPNEISLSDFENIHDRILVPLSNNNTIRKRLSNSEKLSMYFSLLRSKEEINFNGDFVDWIENGTLTVYRGVPSNPDSNFLPLNKYISFTLSKNYAKKFIQPNWSYGGWVDRDVHGYLITATISLKNNFHIYNNGGWEEEVVVKGPLKFDKIEKI